MIRLLSSALAGLFFFSHLTIAEEKKPIPIETMHQIDSLDKAQEKAKELELLVDSMSRQKYSDCLKAFGNERFCQCLRDKSPVGVNFSGYVKVVTTPKEALGYSKADKETKDLIDNTLKAREICITGGNNRRQAP